MAHDEDEEFGPALRELAGCVERAAPSDGTSRFFKSVWLSRSSCPTAPFHALMNPVLCIIAQGTKQVLLGDERYVYDPMHFLLTSVTIPASGQVIEASPQRPYLGVTIELEAAMIESVILEAGIARPSSAGTLRAIESSPMEFPLLQSVLRLARLFDAPEEVPFLTAQALKEIVYHLLTGPQSMRLHQIVSLGGQAQRTVRAIEWVRKNYDQPFSVETLARDLGMSVSALHHQFKDVTAMSPLQFQKQLRLQEAKRLMVTEGFDAAGAGYKVGYDDPSYFSRDYRRFFGEPPRRHVAQLLAGG